MMSPIKGGDLYVPLDFAMEEGVRIPIILGDPFGLLLSVILMCKTISYPLMWGMTMLCLTYSRLLNFILFFISVIEFM